MRRAGRESLNLNHYRHTSRDYGLPLLDKNLNNRNRQMFYHLLNAQLSRYRSCMFTTRLRSSTLSSGYDRKFRDRNRQFGMFEGRNRKRKSKTIKRPRLREENSNSRQNRKKISMIHRYRKKNSNRSRKSRMMRQSSIEMAMREDGALTIR